jgi:hypothetical protein
MVRTERIQMRLVLLTIVLALVLLAFGLAGTATAAGPGTLEPDFRIQPIEGKIIKLTRPIRCPDRMCPDGGSGCSCKRPTEVRPPIRLPIELTAAGDASSGGLMSSVQPVAGQVSVVPSIIRCPDRMCPDGGRGCGCGGSTEDRPPVRLPIGLPGSPILTE